MLEAIKRLIMALVFVYLGGLIMATALSVSYGTEGIGAIQMGVIWPLYVYEVMLLQLGGCSPC